MPQQQHSNKIEPLETPHQQHSNAPKPLEMPQQQHSLCTKTPRNTSATA